MTFLILRFSFVFSGRDIFDRYYDLGNTPRADEMNRTPSLSLAGPPPVPREPLSRNDGVELEPGSWRGPSAFLRVVVFSYQSDSFFSLSGLPSSAGAGDGG